MFGSAEASYGPKKRLGSDASRLSQIVRWQMEGESPTTSLPEARTHRSQGAEGRPSFWRMHVGADNRAMYASEEWLQVESLDSKARVWRIAPTARWCSSRARLPGEQAQVNVSRRKNQWEQGTLTALRRESSQRVAPGCPHFGLHAGACGGCKMQHHTGLAAAQHTLRHHLAR